MAVVAGDRNSTGIFWINDNEDQPMVFVPGVSRNMGLKLGSGGEGKVRARAVSNGEGKGGRKRIQPPSRSSVESSTGRAPSLKTPTAAARSPSPSLALEPPVPLLPAPQALSQTAQARSKASLKDLCPEDKRRIANLIQELARVSEEREESVQRLRDEQETFERKIQQLEQQNQLIVQEREGLQQQYRECQELLGLYQQYLSQQQDQLNQSIAQLNQSRSHGKIPSGEGASSRPWSGGGTGAALDGSYLDRPSSVGGEGVGGGWGVDLGRSATPSLASSSSERDGSPRDGPGSRRGLGWGLGAGWSEPKPGRHSKGERPANGPGCQRVASEPRGPRPSRGQGGPGGGGAQVERGCADPAGRAETAPPAGREDWEEKRRRLVQQKQQLEVERERLQARLAQQEERLIRQNQQLRQSRLDYSRFQQEATAELEHSINGPGHLNQVYEPDGTIGHRDLRGSSHEHLGGNVDQPVHEALQCDPADVTLPKPILSHEMSAMAASPVASPAPTLPHVLPRTPQARFDSSLTELLDLFSPITMPKRNPRPAQQWPPAPPRQPPSALRPPRRTLLPPPGPLGPRQEDPEESQILEDIFFIC